MKAESVSAYWNCTESQEMFSHYSEQAAIVSRGVLSYVCTHGDVNSKVST